MKPALTHLNHPRLWIVSPGCSASSMVFTALLDAYAQPQEYSQTQVSFIRKSHAHYTGSTGQSFIKSDIHGLSMVPIGSRDKVIYIYSHPLNILIGFGNKQLNDPGSWEGGDPHYINYLECDITESFWDNYLYKDILNLERHLDGWWRPHDFNLFCVKYESLHESTPLLNSFLNEGEDFRCSLALPPYRRRSTDWAQHPDKERMLATYAPLITKFQEKPPYEWVSP